ncbi:MAG: YihY family inner membrane protein [Deltaproteobacteria bacterium]|nr:YihY family inner membrane protein [Deltaproteobacteria bacterium]
MGRWKTQRNRLDDFLAHGLWENQGEGISKRRRFLYHNIRICVIVFRKFFEDRCPMRASSLTYTSLLAIVPLFALMFSVLKGFGVQNTLETIVLKKITIGSEEIVHHIIGYINNTNAARLGTMGLAILILTVMSMLSNIEKSFNHIWGVRETRSTFRRFSDFLSVLVLGPVFIFAAISMTSTLQSQVFLQRLLEMAYVGEVILILFKTLPFVVMWAAFTFLYIFMPNAKVRLSSALVGGIFGGTIWQLAQWGFVHAQVGVARYNAIYGTLAALPILMIWIYLSWIIVLLGLIVTYAWQNTEIIRRETSEQRVSFMCREKTALAILILVTRKFYENGQPWDLQRISGHLNLPPRLRMRVLDELVDLGFLSEVVDEGEESAYQPAKAPERVAVADIIAEFRRQGDSLDCSQEVNEWYRVNELEEQLKQVQTQALEGMTLKDLALGGALTAKGQS